MQNFFTVYYVLFANRHLFSRGKTRHIAKVSLVGLLSKVTHGYARRSHDWADTVTIGLGGGRNDTQRSRSQFLPTLLEADTMARVMYISETNGGVLTRRHLKCRMSWARFATSRGKTHSNRDKNPQNKCYDNPDVNSSPLISKSLGAFAFWDWWAPFSIIQKCTHNAKKSFLRVLKFASLPTLQQGHCRRVKSFIISACDSPCRWLTFVSV